MATIGENLQQIIGATAEIKRAIIDKGGDISGDITTWASAIDGISAGGVTPGKKNDVTFYDYDGTILYSYTASEFLALTEFPEFPEHEGLVCQEWNYTLADAQDYVSTYGTIDIGATYTTDDGKTRLYIRIVSEGRMEIPLYISQTVSNGVVIDWGDGSPTETINGTGYVNTRHSYSSIGDYVITLEVTSGILGFGDGTVSYCVLGSTALTGRVYCNTICKAEIGSGVTALSKYAFNYCQALASITIPNSVTELANYALGYCFSLKHVTIPKSIKTFGANVIRNCQTIESAIFPKGLSTLNSSAFYYCTALKGLVIPSGIKTIAGSSFYYCTSLAEMIFPSSVTSITTSVFGECQGMAVYDFTHHTAVPTLSNTSSFTNIPADCVIKVPSALVDTWKSATNWSALADKIVGV